jgi:hypothetical protein
METMSQSVDEIANYILSKAADAQILIGPLIAKMLDDSEPAIPYVVVCSGDEDKQMHCDQIMCHDEIGRRGLILALVARRRPIVIHDMDDELAMVKLAEVIWPCDKARRIIAATEAERKGADNG